MSSVERQLQGFKALDKKLRDLGPAVGGKILRQSVSAAMLPVLKGARQSAPKGSRLHRTYKGRLVAPGFLSRNIRRTSRLSRDGRLASADVRARGEAFYGGLLEKGTKHIDGKPWLGPAFEHNLSTVENALKKALLRRILRVARR